jgi:F-box-like
MPRIANLPNEILLEIFEQCDHYYNLSLVCKKWQAFNEPFLYSKICISYQTLRKFLWAILSRPRLGGLIHRFQYMGRNFCKIGIDNEELRVLFEAAVETLGIAFAKQLYFEEETIDYTDSSAQLVLLLHYMPILQELQFCFCELGRPLVRYLNAKATPHPTSSTDACPIILDTLKSIYTFDIESKDLLPFLLLPSIEMVEFEKVHGDDLDWGPRISDTYYGTSPVKSLTLYRSDISTKALHQLLRVPRSLRVFKYGSDWVDRTTFCKAMAPLHNSLEELVLRQRGYRRRYFMPIKPFTKLKRLNAKLHIFAKREDELVEVLPTGLEEIITITYSLRELEQLVEWVELKWGCSRLMRVGLDHVNHRNDKDKVDSYIERLRAACKSNGISLQLPADLGYV